MRSTNHGISWKNIGGPGNVQDGRNIISMNDNILLAMDSEGSIWATFNSGGDSLISSPSNGILSFSQKTLFIGDTASCSISRLLSIFSSGCGSPNIKKTEILGRDSSSYSLISVTGDSIRVNCSLKDSGQLSASLVITFSDDISDTILLNCFSTGQHPLSFLTSDQSNDTIGGSMNVPITINGLDHAEDIDLILHYDNDLKYNGTYSPANIELDIPSEKWNGRSKLHITQAQSNTILGYARFDVFGDSNRKSYVTFDSVTVLTAVTPCQYIMPTAVTSTITSPSGCGVQILSDFIRNGTLPELNLIPNPTNGEISINTTRDLGEVNIIIYDMLGIMKGVNLVTLNKNTPTKLVLPSVNGVYNIRVKSITGSYDLRAIVNR
jgi:hypothetical protein